MMNQKRPLLYDVRDFDAEDLLAEWQWLVPRSDTPLFLSVFGDWVVGNPDGSLWLLSVLEGSYRKIADNSKEYNSLNKQFEWLDAQFQAGWLEIADRHGLSPKKNECLGWKLHPILGGKFEVQNLQIFSMRVYQSLMGQLHRQLKERSGRLPKKGPGLKFVP